MVVAMAALFIAFGGAASANVGLVDGHQIKAGTVGRRRLASHSVWHANLGIGAVQAANVSASLLKQLKGGQSPSSGSTGATRSQGPKGDTGPQGPQGLKGDTGATGSQGPQGSLFNYEVDNGTDWMLGNMPLALPDYPCSCYQGAGIVVDLGFLDDTDFRGITHTGQVFGGGHLADKIWIADGPEAFTPGVHKLSDPIDSTYGSDNGDGTFTMLADPLDGQQGKTLTSAQIEAKYDGYEAYAWVGLLTDGSDGASGGARLTSVDGMPVNADMSADDIQTTVGTKVEAPGGNAAG